VTSSVVLRSLAPGDEAHVHPLLEQYTDSSLFLRRNLAVTGLTDLDERYHGTWAGAFESERLVAVAQHSRFSTLLLQAPVHTGAVAELAVRASGRPVGGLLGSWSQALVARAALGLDRVPMRVESHEGLYALPLDALVVPYSLARGTWRCRRADADDLEMLVEWRASFNVETNGQTDGPTLRASSREEIEYGLRKGAAWVLEVDDTPVAFQQFNAMLADVVQVGGVWTPPALRRRGYARAVVVGSLLAARADGVRRGVLFTGETNMAAQRAYAALGFTRVGDWALLFFQEPVLFR
jgi:RimJ/RimL family protein N-acetyltransferase